MTQTWLCVCERVCVRKLDVVVGVDVGVFLYMRERLFMFFSLIWKDVNIMYIPTHGAFYVCVSVWLCVCVCLWIFSHIVRSAAAFSCKARNESHIQIHKHKHTHSHTFYTYMYIYMYFHTYIYIYMYIDIYIYTHTLHVHTHTHAHTHIHIHGHVHITYIYQSQKLADFEEALIQEREKCCALAAQVRLFIFDTELTLLIFTTS